MHETEDVNHFMARCPARHQIRYEMVAAVRETLPPDVLEWLGSPYENPERWAAVWLDGELEGVPYAEAYGRSTRAIRAFRDFERYKEHYLGIIRMRTTLRRRMRRWIVALVERGPRRAGTRGGPARCHCVRWRQPCAAPLMTSGRRRERGPSARGGVPVQQRGSSQEGLVPNPRECSTANP